MEKTARRRFIKLSLAVLLSAPIRLLIGGIARARGDKGELLWKRVVTDAVDESGWVDYKKISNTLKGEFDGFLIHIAESLPVTRSGRKEQLAFWINAYNAICIRSLIDAGVPSEVPHSKALGANIFTQKKYRVAGKIRSLDEIEHQIIRKRFADNRVHAALVCGASSCPKLRPEPYYASILDRQLDEECCSWIQKEKTKKGQRKNFLDAKNNILYLSKIFDWYREDFGNNKKAVIAFVARYASPTDRQRLAQGNVAITYLDYDWRINNR